MNHVNTSDARWGRIYRYVRIIIVVVPILLLIWIVDQNYVFSGHRHIVLRPGEGTKYIKRMTTPYADKIYGTDRASRKPYQLISAKSLEFDVDLPRSFTKIGIGMTYTNPYEQPEINLVLSNPRTGIVRQMPFARYHPVVEQLVSDIASGGATDADTWTTIRSGDVLLLQRAPTYASIEALLRDPPDSDRVRTLWFEPLTYTHLPTPSTATDIRLPLEGSHALWLNAAAGKVNVQVDYLDRNEQDGADAVQLTLKDVDGMVLATVENQDDGNVSHDRQRSERRELAIALDDVRRGVYQLEMSTSRDVVFAHLRIDTADVFFRNTVALAGSEELTDGASIPMQWYSSSKSVSLRPQSDEGLQRVSNGTWSIELETVGHQYHWSVRPNDVPITLQHLDVVLKTNGLLSLSPIPDEPVLGLLEAERTVDDLEGVDYLLADYPDVQRKEGMFIATRTIEGSDALTSLGRQFHVSFDFPRLPRDRRFLQLYNVTLDLEKPPLRLVRAIKRLFGLDSNE